MMSQHLYLLSTVVSTTIDILGDSQFELEYLPHLKYESFGEEFHLWDPAMIEQLQHCMHARLTNEYMETGENVKIIANIFQSWFLLPWIIFFLASSVEDKDILSMWNEKRENVETLPIYSVLSTIQHKANDLPSHPLHMWPEDESLPSPVP